MECSQTNQPSPANWPPHYNAGIRCDMLRGPCSCGAWHSIKDWDHYKSQRRPTVSNLFTLLGLLADLFRAKPSCPSPAQNTTTKTSEEGK